MRKFDTAEAGLIVLVIVLGCLAGMVIWLEYNRPTYPASTADCPPGHVYVDWGDTSRPGCMPEGVARELNVYPKPDLEVK